VGYRDENRMHRRNGVGSLGSKYSCPKCGHGLKIPKPVFMTVCGKCNAIIEKDDIVIKGE